MKKALRKLLIVIPVVIIVLLVMLLVAVGLFADHAVKIGIEKGGAAALPVPVKVGGANLSILSGDLALSNLRIGNPEGYKHENLLELKNGSVGVNVRSLLSDTIEIRQIKLDGAVVVLEQKDLLHNNIKDILKALPKDDEADKTPTETQPEEKSKNLHIDELVISNTTVKVKLLPLPGKADTIPLKLATIRMTDLGSDKKMSTAKLIGTILSAIFRGIAEQGTGILPDDLIGGLKETMGKTLDAGKEIIKEATGLGQKILEGGGDTTKKVLDNAGDAGKKILEGAGDTGKGITEGLKGILGPKKKEE
ncbi:MAG: AsmA family protein [Sedimentisphaerales bacterium]|nr:AsmA family protein [Sedimentisphaerales bacterium]